MHLHRGGDVPLLRPSAQTNTRAFGGAGVRSGVFGLPSVIGGGGGRGGGVRLPSLLLGGQVGPVLLGSQPVVVVADVELRGLLTHRVHLELSRRGH